MMRHCGSTMLAGSAGLSLLMLASTAAVAQVQNLPARIRVQTQKIEIQANSMATDTRHVEMQVLTPAAVTQLAQMPIGFIEALQDVELLEGYTQKADGRKIDVDKSAVITRQTPGAPQLPLFSDARQKVIVFPNVEAGDTLVYTVKVREKASMFPGHYQQAAAFSPLLPLDSLDVTVTAPKRLGFSVEAHDVEFHKSDSGNNDVFTLHYANLNPVSEDNAAVSQLDREPRYFVSNFRSYEEFAQSYAAMIETKSAATAKIRAQADAITAGIA